MVVRNSKENTNGLKHVFLLFPILVLFIFVGCVFSEHTFIHKKKLIYLDDERLAPDGWILLKDVNSVIRILKENTVKEISLDHDLGTDENGYDVLLWIEKEVHLNNYMPPKIHIHTANLSARIKMELCVKNINEFLKKKNNCLHLNNNVLI